MTEAQELHRPVLLNECMDALLPEVGGLFIDATFGRGGHAKALLARMPSDAKLLAFDRDPSALAAASELARSDSRINLVHANYADIAAHVGVASARGILMDLGVSSPQLDVRERGFSFQTDGPLDMRMDTTRGLTAEQWLASVSEAELIAVLQKLGEEPRAKAVARAIVAARATAPITSTRELAAICAKHAEFRPGRHAATRTFQAIRMTINAELENLALGLQAALAVLADKGRIAVISFHSLEDRLVKNFFRELAKPPGNSRRGLPIVDAFEPGLRLIGKAIFPTDAEQRQNPRARSAVLRVAERIR
jgi:16S rRNA (cytosine1402-N4)-methyltransferase